MQLYFTTLTPNLGLCGNTEITNLLQWQIFRGLLKEATEGKGLGRSFLTTYQRNSIGLFMIPDSPDHIKIIIFSKELEEYNPELTDKDIIISVSCKIRFIR